MPFTNQLQASRAVLLGLSFAIGCADPDDGERDRRLEGEAVQAPALSPELEAQLKSDDPIPPPMVLPIPEGVDDPRASYVEWLRASGTALLVVEVRELTPVRRGELARVE